MATISFNKMQLIEETTQTGERYISPVKDSFDNLENSFHMLIDGIYYEVNVDSSSDDYIWFDFDYGKPDPIDDKLTNIETGEKRDNSRESYEAELLGQLFVLYDFTKKILYISSIKKERFLENILRQKLSKAFIVKRFYKNRDEFINTLRNVKQISFTEARNLFNLDSTRRQALVDLTGTDAPEKFVLTTEYSQGTPLQNLQNWIGSLIDSKSNSELKELVVKGVDENGFDCVFNVDSFVEKIVINCEKKENGKYESEEIKNSLLKRINQ